MPFHTAEDEAFGQPGGKADAQQNLGGIANLAPMAPAGTRFTTTLLLVFILIFHVHLKIIHYNTC
jgi:hypothetical protein